MPTTCPYCREAIPEADEMLCPACQTPHHKDCWKENGGCTVFGCACAPPDEPKLDLAKMPLPPSMPPLPTTAGTALLPGIYGARSGTGHFFAELLRQRRALLRNMLLAGIVAVPLGGIAGALLGLAVGFISAIFGAGAGAILTFPMNGACFGQAFTVCAGMIGVAILGEGFVGPLRRKVVTLVKFIFEDTAISPTENGQESPPPPSI